MTKTITRDDVLRYTFKETSNDENLAIENELLQNESLMDFYKQSVETVHAARRIELKPSDRAINNILNYSEATKAVSIG